MAGLSDTESMQAFVDEYDLPFESTVSEDGSLWTAFGIPYQGAWFFLNDDGSTQVVPHDLTASQLAAALDELLST